MTATLTTPQDSRPTAIHRRTRGMTVIAAVVATGAIYIASRALGTDFKLTDPGKTETHQLILPEIAVFTAVFALLGWAALAVLERFTHRAMTIWTTLAAAVLLLSLVPIALEQATASTKIMLVVIHTTVAAVLIPAVRLTRH